MSKRIVIGITGRTGSGKSNACEWIKTHIQNVEHIDCDDIGHEVLDIPTIQHQLIHTFGDGIMDNHHINRTTLGNIVFKDQQQLNLLNAIVHPTICDHVSAIIDGSQCNIIVIEGALIHHVGLEHICTTTICIDAPTEAILTRRPANQLILDRQPKANDYMNMCSHTIKNNGSLDDFYKKLQQLFDRLHIA